MKKNYVIRVKYKNGKEELLKYDKHVQKRDARFLKLKRDKSVLEVVACEIWE